MRTTLFRTAATVGYSAIGLALVITTFWYAGRYAHLSYLGAEFSSLFIAICCAGFCAITLRKSNKSVVTHVFVCVGVVITCILASIRWMAMPTYLHGFSAAVSSAAPLSIWQRLGSDLQGHADILGRIPKEHLPSFVKEVLPGEAVYCRLLTPESSSTNVPSVVIVWRGDGFALGIVIGSPEAFAARILDSKRLSNSIYVAALHDQ